MLRTLRRNSTRENRRTAPWRQGLFKTIWMNTLHRHFAENKHWTEWGFEWPPHIEATGRIGSNCGGATLDEEHSFYVSRHSARWEVSTEHSRNGDGLNGVPNIAKEIFKAMMGHPEWWAYANVYFNGFASDMPEADRGRLQTYARENAHQMMGYGDERLLANWQRVEDLRGANPHIRFYKGLELNILPSQQFDTTLGSDPRCELRICALHPKIDPEGFARHRTDPDFYSQFMTEVTRDLDFDIMAHPAYSCNASLPGTDAETEFRNAMEWGELLGALLTRDTALEINWSRVYQAGCNKLGEWSEESWREEARILFEQTPFLNDDRVMAQLAPWIERGLLIAVNNDGHYVPKNHIARTRFDKYIAMFSQWVDERMIRYDISPNQVINAWSVTRLDNWLAARRAS